MTLPAAFMRLTSRLLFPLTMYLTCPAALEGAEFITLNLPIKCELGVTCFVQNYVDHDDSDHVRDYHCGGRTYDGHNGTDIRIPDMGFQRAGVEVLASAAGTVTGIRDGVEDVSVRTTGKQTVAGKECGNGVVVEHGNGWRTQYCHMAKGSLRIKVGDRVAAGQTIGLVGLSGATEFPHVHFTVRHHGKIVDPFAYEALPDSCGGGHQLWAASVREQTKYRAREVLNFGFSDLAPTMELIESGDMLKHPVRAESSALTAYVRAIGLQQGDEQTLTLLGPGGPIISEYKAPFLERNKAQYFVSTGRKRQQAWAMGNYTAIYRVTKNDEEVFRTKFEVKLGSQ